MSVTGRSQDATTKPSSFETLDLPLSITHSGGRTDNKEVRSVARISNPLKQKTRVIKGKDKDKDGSDSESHYSQGNIDPCTVLGVDVKQNSDVSVHVKTPREPYQTANVTAVSEKIGEKSSRDAFSSRATDRRRTYSVENPDQRQGVATYVTTQQNNANNLDSLVNEFTAYARKSRAQVVETRVDEVGSDTETYTTENLSDKCNIGHSDLASEATSTVEPDAPLHSNGCHDYTQGEYQCFTPTDEDSFVPGEKLENRHLDMSNMR